MSRYRIKVEIVKSITITVDAPTKRAAAASLDGEDCERLAALGHAIASEPRSRIKRIDRVPS